MSHILFLGEHAMSTGKTFTLVVEEYAQKLFEEFHPYPDLEKGLKKARTLLYGLVVLFLLSLLVERIGNSEEMYWVMVGLAISTLITLYLLTLVSSVLEEERIDQFKKTHTDLASILWQ